MKRTKEEIIRLFTLDEFPRSAKYDPMWILENVMGPNVVWLTEALSQKIELQPEARVLDLGCGKAISSIFLAKEFQTQVWATDLWIGASENWQRICAANMQKQVFPIYAEAHTLPFANDFFDTIVSLDAYHYFGTDDLYLGYIAQFVCSGGTIAIVVPGVLHELTDGVPDRLAPYWSWDWYSFHSPQWWKQHWEKTGLVEVVSADIIPDGWQHWLKWMEVCLDEGLPSSQEEIEMLRADKGRTLCFTRLVARKK